MISEVAEAVITQFNDTQELEELLTGGLWFTKASQKAEMPYGVFHIIAVTPTEYMGGADDNIQTLDLQISLFSEDDNGSYEIADMVKQFHAGFNWQTLTITDYTYIKCANVGTQPVLFIDEVWQTILLYELQIVKT